VDIKLDGTGSSNAVGTLVRGKMKFRKHNNESVSQSELEWIVLLKLMTGDDYKEDQKLRKEESDFQRPMTTWVEFW
jgi:hypothetical protein